eukprot:2571806-Pleurochrysis_carterae.AAC.1
MTHVEKELLYVPGKTHVKEGCATLNQAHKLQVGTQLLKADDGCCYISDGAESLQTEYLAQLLSCHDADGNLKATALDRMRIACVCVCVCACARARLYACACARCACASVRELCTNW